eukprot:CAMPEP_0114113702 /NCGR_PEP_ID=MMETSP0043_2-20121206/3052_1 /TAXON_ID=464988 /ORGANISM="Hemiselmis andersenii, Strain CCMP644" /LENGTH=233 /DNA_ID=CAMNT_0001205867 /DNA_START=67 /DNA_END=768 /DNA_ORIENTATION=-
MTTQKFYQHQTLQPKIDGWAQRDCNCEHEHLPSASPQQPSAGGCLSSSLPPYESREDVYKRTAPLNGQVDGKKVPPLGEVLERNGYHGCLQCACEDAKETDHAVNPPKVCAAKDGLCVGGDGTIVPGPEAPKHYKGEIEKAEVTRVKGPKHKHAQGVDEEEGKAHTEHVHQPPKEGGDDGRREDQPVESPNKVIGLRTCAGVFPPPFSTICSLTVPSMYIVRKTATSIQRQAR